MIFAVAILLLAIVCLLLNFRCDWLAKRVASLEEKS